MSHSLSSNPSQASTTLSKSPSQDQSPSLRLSQTPFLPIFSNHKDLLNNVLSNQFSLFSLLYANTQPQTPGPSIPSLPSAKKTFNPLIITSPDMLNYQASQAQNKPEVKPKSPKKLVKTQLTPTEAEVDTEERPFSLLDAESIEKSLEELERVSKARILPKSKKISKEANRSPKDQSDKPKKSRNSWSQDEDAKLLSLIESCGKRWAEIARLMTGRTGKQVRDRYLNVLTPNINKGTWTQIEDQMIMAMYGQMGPQWCRISEHLDGRTEAQVKNRYYTFLKKSLEKEKEREMEIEQQVKTEKLEDGFCVKQENQEVEILVKKEGKNQEIGLPVKNGVKVETIAEETKENEQVNIMKNES